VNSAHEWLTLIEAFRSLPPGGPPRAALATIVRTRGSTFRRASARMLVHDDGGIVCALSGGCPQHDIVLRAREAIADGRPRVVGYNAESGLDLLMEMGCGGELDVLVEPLSPPSSIAFAGALAEALATRRRAWLATWFAVAGQVMVPRHLVWHDGHMRHDGFDDAALSRAVVAAAETWPGERAATLCLPANGGDAEILLEPVAPPHALVVIGSSAAALALVPMATLLGWSVTLVDQDPRRLPSDRLPPGLRTVCAVPSALREAVALDAYTSAIVMTHNVEADTAYLAALRDSPLAYVGALGSRERAARLRDEARFAGGRALHAPAGLDIGSETPAEIALSIVGEILAVTRQHGGGFLHRHDGPLHG
jgi:xanthine/CO dehydrogenase XdhC/CoxF family maturation factor